MYSKGAIRIAPSQATPMAIHHHFSRIAKRYRNLRTTDLEPITIVVRELKNLARIEGIDMGCGAGRDDLGLIFSFPIPGYLHRYFSDAFKSKAARIRAVAMIRLLFHSFIGLSP